MKKHLLFILLAAIAFESNAQGYNISLQCNYKKGIAYLTHYLGKDFMVQDSAAVSNTGKAIFKSSTKMPGGIYVIIFPGKRLTVDFLVDNEQNINIIADTNNLDKVQITGTPANVLFKEYKTMVNIIGKELTKARDAYDKSKTKQDSAKNEAIYKTKSKELNTYRENIVKTKPTSMMAALLNAMRESPQPTKIPVTRKDSIENYNFYKSHYWDGVTFMDDRIIRTPFFLPKLENYYRQIMPQAADSIIKDVDYKLLLARSAPEMFKFLLNWYTDEYINPKYMGQDAVFVHLYLKYHSQKLSPWLNKSQDSIITRRANMLIWNLIGVQAANLEMVDTAGKPATLYDVKAEYTLVVFWDPNCGHCKEEIPRIDSIYRASWKSKNVKIYAVLSEPEKQKEVWLTYIREHKIEDWINVYQTAAALEDENKNGKQSYRQSYDVVVTPTMLLLDKDKHIKAKKLTIEQLNDLLESNLKKDKK
jgi:thiol-disulfide isomerase/thioredoxin